MNEQIVVLNWILYRYSNLLETLTPFGTKPAFPILAPSPLPSGHFCPAEVGYLRFTDLVTHCFAISMGHVSAFALYALRAGMALFPLLWVYMAELSDGDLSMV